MLIPRNKLDCFVGKNIHIAGLAKGCVFKLMSIIKKGDKEIIYVETPSTRKSFTFPSESAMYINKDIPK